MAPVLTVVLASWACIRWTGVLAALVRARRFEGPQRRECRRAIVTRASTSVLVSVAALYAWAQWQRLQPADNFVGFIAAVVLGSMAVGSAAAFMQPKERTPETLDIFRVLPGRRVEPAPRGSESGPSG